MTISQKVLWPSVLNTVVAFALLVTGEIAKDPQLRDVGLGLLGAGALGGGVGYAVPHVGGSRRPRSRGDRPS